MHNPNKHPFHIVAFSPWPLMASFSCFYFVLGLTFYFHEYTQGRLLTLIGIISILFVMYAWWRDVTRESIYEGIHTTYVQEGLRKGVLLFIISEFMFFFGFFWSFFHSALAPVFEIGCVWPPAGIQVIEPWGIPLLNTFILLVSGCTLTWAHYAILSGSRQEGMIAFICTIILAIYFTYLQFFEYLSAPFSISSGIYGSTFFLITGFHGFHVIVGTIFIFICFLKFINHHFSKNENIGLEAAIWYWHFVDVIWLFVFVLIYWWGGK